MTARTLPPDTLARLRLIRERLRDAERRAAQAQRARKRARIAAGCWDRPRVAERQRRE